MKNSTEKLIVTLKKLFGKYSKIFLFVLFLLMGHISLAQYVTPDSAKIVASKYLSNYLNQPKFKSSQKFDLKLIQTSQSDKKIEKSQFKSSSVPLYYVFSINAKDGFILIAADRKVQPIIGLSYIKNGDNNFSNIPPALKDWLLFLKEQIQEILFSRNSVKLKQNDGWNKILRNFKEGISDEFLLKTSWGQSYPFSNLIKEIVPVGCVTTGEAQIINYYRYPFKINSIHSYLESGNAPQIGTLNSKGYPINYLKFKNHYEGNKPGTSEDFDSIDYFTYDVAVSLETDFGNYSFIGGDGSSGYLKSPIHRDVVESLNEDYLYLLAEFWSIANHPLSGLTDWENKIKDEIIQNRPVLINSKDKNGGVQHAFICDGYSASMDKFHFNFGWYGNGDGWFSLDLITPIVTDEDGSKYYYDYSYNYPALNFTMLINIMPDLTRVQQDPYESDNDFSSATSLNNNQPQLHSISPKTDKDYYKLNLTSKANVIIETQGVNGNTQMWLYDGNHGYLAWDDDSGEGQNSKMTKTLEKGTYYIMVEVKGTSQCIPSYSIQYTATYTPRTLTVNSSNPNSGVEISISPNDNNGQGIGTTQFKRVYDDNTTVTLTAPQTASGNTFVKWQIDGTDLTSNQEIKVTLDADVSVTAIYSTPAPTPRTLTVNSSNPNSGVEISISPNDNNGQGNDTTQFKRVYDDNTTVTLTAPQTASGNTFVKWQKDGTDLTSNQEIKVTLDADVSVTAIYKTPSIERILTFYSSNPDSNVVISVSPEDINGQSNGTTPFKRIYFDNTNITIKAPSSALGNKFLKWLKSDVHYYYNGQSISFTLDSDISVTAVFKSESCNYYDSLALVALYNATKGDEWTNNSGWLIDSVKYWYGITLDTYGKVIGIELTKNNLQDSLPIDIGNLDSLQNLYLNENLLSGTIPSTIGNLSHLQILSLYNNHLTGTIPSEIGNLKNLQKIYLGSNYLTDSIPLEIGNLTNLTMLQLSNNYLTGTIPSTIFNLSHLQYLILMANGFSGEIPSSVGNLSDLKWLNLKYNAFSGQVPSEIADLTNLNLLMLGYNNFSGEIPEGIWGLKNLMYFGLEGNQFTGDIPSQINNKTYLYELNIENNLFNSLPDLSPLSNLQTLSIQNNNFTFKDIVPNMNVAKRSFTYSPQAKVDTIQHYLVGPGDSLRLSVSIKDSADSYQWYRNGDTISGANDSVYTIKNYEESNDFGVYTYKVRNNIATALTLESNDIYVDEKGSKQNVALSSNGGIAYAQSELTINGEKQYAGLINDGFRTTKWHASWLMIYPQMLAIKLNDTYAIDSVVIWWGSNNSMGSTLFLFADTNWVAVHPEKHDKREIIPKLYRQVVPFGGQKADSIQLVIYYYYYSNDSPLTIGEVEVYGSKLNAIQNIKVEKSFIVYPNPTKTSIYIRFKDFSFKEISIIIYDNQGKVLVTKYFNQTPSEPIKLNMANYPMGLYYIHIITNQGNAIKKFIIKR